MAIKKQYISADGLQKIKQELEYLKKIERPDVVAKISEAKAMGDLSENAAYSEAKEQQAFIEGRILQLEDIIKNAVVIEKKTGGTVTIGAAVKVQGNGKTKEYKIVGSNEANPAEGKISNESPLGRAFLGRKIGDEVAIETPAGKIVYKILTIN